MSHPAHKQHADHGHADAHGHGDPGALHVHALPLSLLIGVFAILVFLTFLTVAATWVQLGPLNIWIALFIAFVKASLVCLYFMHLRYDNPFNSMIVVASLLFVALFIAFALMDSGQYQHVIQSAIDKTSPTR